MALIVHPSTLKWIHGEIGNISRNVHVCSRSVQIMSVGDHFGILWHCDLAIISELTRVPSLAYIPVDRGHIIPYKN